MHCLRRAMLRSSYVIGMCVIAFGSLAMTATAADITWSLNDFNSGNLDLSGSIVQAVNFSANSQTVTIGTDTATFVSSSTISPDNAGFLDGPNENAALAPSYTNVVGNAELIGVLQSHSWTGDVNIQTITLSGLFAGQSYQLQAFMHDGRTTGCTGLPAGCGSGIFNLSDGQGNDSATVARNSGSILVGSFTADASTQTFDVVGGEAVDGRWDPALSGYVLRSLSGGAVTATINRDTNNLSISNGVGSPLDILGYTVSSPFGSLDPANWSSVANNYDQNAEPTPGNNSIDSNDSWTIFMAANSELSEGELNLAGPRDGGAIGASQTLNLGNVWFKSPVEDVEIQILRTDGSTFDVPVTFTGNDGQPFPFGDLNFSGSMDPDDWDLYIAGGLTDLSGLSPAEAYRAGDLNNDGVNNLTDMNIFIETYETDNGAGSFAAMLSGVPEPSSWLLLTIAAVALTCRRRGLRLPIRSRVVCVAMMLMSAAAAAVLSGSSSADAAGINWGTPFSITGPADIDTAGVLVEAVDFTDVAQVDDRMVVTPSETITFVPVHGDNAALSGNNFPYNDSYSGTQGFYSVDTGDAGFNDVLNGQVWTGTDGADSLVSYTLSNLVLGATYQLQILGPADDRSCCSARTLQADDSLDPAMPGNLSAVMARGDAPSVIGVFTADGATQGFSIRGADPTPADPAIGGYILRALEGSFTLELQVNTTTGAVSIANPTASNYDLKGYEIFSEEDGSLITGGWTVPAGWDKAGGASEFGLLAGSLDGSYSLMAENGNAPLSLGSAYNTGVGGDDLTFRFLTADGALGTGTVSYITDSGVPGDFSGNGAVENADLTLLLNNWAQSVPPAPAGWIGTPQPTSPSIDNDELTALLNNWGRTSGGGSSSARAVPEPGTWLLALLGLAAVPFCRRQRTRCVLCPASVSKARMVRAAAALACFAWAGSCFAAALIDRDYQFGDDLDEDAANAVNNEVGTGPQNVGGSGFTIDSMGPVLGSYADLGANGSPVYIDVSITSANLTQARPGASAGSRGIVFDGSDDRLISGGLNFPQNSASAKGGSIVGPLDYDNILDRGFQLWVYPNSAKQGTLQDVVMDSEQHGVRINADGNWVMRYDGADVVSSSAVDFNQWSHVMVAQSFGQAGPSGGSILYVNGEAVAARAGDYDTTDIFNLVVGANSGGAEGTLNFFQGVLDDMNLFVMGRVRNGPTPAAGTYTFNLGTDNAYVASPSLGLTGIAGDVNQNGGIDQGDIDDFIAGWGNENLVDGVRIGDINTIRNGDLNFDGVTNIADAYLLHSAASAGSAAGLDFSGLSSVAGNLPEPSTFGLATVLLVGTGWQRWARRKQR